MRFRPALPLLAGVVLMASPVLRAADVVDIGTWSFPKDKKVSIQVEPSANATEEEAQKKQGFFRLEQGDDFWILMNEAQRQAGKGNGLGRNPRKQLQADKGDQFTLRAVFEEEDVVLDQVLLVQVGTYAPFRVWVHRKSASEPIKVEFGDGKKTDTPGSKVKIQQGNLTHSG